MNAVAQMKPATDIVALVEATPVLVLTDKQKFSEFYEAMKAECDALKVDLETEKGRKAIASMAYKVARTKTAIDDAGKKLNEESRARINAVDESRREIREQLDALKVEVRAPLTEWENAKEARQKQVDEVMTWLRGSAKVKFDESAADIRARIVSIAATKFPADMFQGYAVQGEALKAVALSSLEAIADRMDQEEAQRAELEKLREQAAKREAEDQARLEAEEAHRQKDAADKLAAEAKARAEAEQKEREEAAAKAAEQRARDEAEAKARAEREATQLAHAEELAAERRRTEEAEAFTQAERDRLAREEAARKAAADKEAKEQAARDTDRAHHGEVMRAAKEAIMEAGSIDEAAAKLIVLAIAAGSGPANTIRF